MSFEEKGTWVYLALAVVIPPFYFAHVLRQVGEMPAADVAYIGPMITAGGAAVVGAIVSHIVIAILKPSEADKRDVRDRQISRRGEVVGGVVLSVATVGVLALTMFEADHFWIANAIYGAFIMQAISSSVVKLVLYRRGLTSW